MLKSTVARVVALLLVTGLVPFAYGEATFGFPETGLEVSGRVTLLAIDDQALQEREGLRLRLSTPTVHPTPVLTPEVGDPSAPDSMAAHFYGTVLHHGGRYQMWYYAVSYKKGAPGDLAQGPVCYAESDDGIHWTKPELGQVEINGSTANNAIKLSNEPTQCAAVVIDEREPDPNKRYKMVYMAFSHTWTFRTATSPDGITWTVVEERPSDKFLEMGSFYRFGDTWVVHGQSGGTDADGNPEGRQGYASTSTDFIHWDTDYVPAFRLPEPADVTKRGLIGDYPQVHLGVGGASFGNVAVGLYGIWHNPSEEARRKTGWYGAGLITCDLGLVVSNDGVTFREPVKGNVFISGSDSPVTPAPGVDSPTILCQANGILNVGDETRIYHGRWRNATETRKYYYGEVALATLPRDRWGGLSLTPEYASGSLLSAPVRVPSGGAAMSLNASGAGLLSIELTDSAGVPLPAFSGAHQGRIQGGQGLEHRVRWAGDGLAGLAGETIRIRVRFRAPEATLYALYLDPVPAS